MTLLQSNLETLQEIAARKSNLKNFHYRNMDFLKKIRQFLYYWYVRYLMATELYMVETWEKIVVHVTLLILFALVGLFNYSIVLNTVQKFSWQRSYAEVMS